MCIRDSRISWGNARGQHPNDAALLPHSTLGHFVSKLIGAGFIMVLGFFQRFEIKYIMKLTNNPPDVLVRKSTVLHRIDHISPAGVVAPRLGHHSGCLLYTSIYLLSAVAEECGPQMQRPQCASMEARIDGARNLQKRLAGSPAGYLRRIPAGTRKPVSYTHLDVYKRQILTSLERYG